MNPYSRWLEMMEERGETRNGHNMTVASVTCLAPLTIVINEALISVNLHCNPALISGLNPGAISTTETALKQCLTAFYNTFKLSVSDKVLVQQVGDQFYILCKVVDV